MKKISVIIPCYNVAPYIDRCLTSVTAQTIGWSCLEIICIDDASEDDTWKRLQAWEQRFPDHMILIRLEANARQGTARNIALHYASADYIAFIDADDWIEPDYLIKLYAPAVRLGCDVVSCGVKRDASDGLTYFEEEARKSGEDQCLILDTESKTKLMIVRKLLGGEPCAKVIRKSLLMEYEVFFLEGLTYEDLYWSPLLHIYTKKAYIVGLTLYHYYQNPNSTMNARNQTHHIDWVTVQMAKWEEYHKRGLFDLYREELECDALRDAAGFLNILSLRYDRPPFSYFQLEKKLINQFVPDYASNPYLKHFSDLFCMFLKALYSPTGPSEFQEVAKQTLRHYMGKPINASRAPE